jgi:hypothetical protein
MRKFLLLFTLAGIYCVSLAQSTTPKLAIDHIIIWTEKGAPEIKDFEKKGFKISPLTMAHTGFGTGGRYINFYNVYLEFLYLDDQVTTDAKLAATLPSRRAEAYRNGKSPFGLGLSMTPYDLARIPIEAEEVVAPWMRSDTGVYFATSNLKYEQEPFILIVPPYMESLKVSSIDEVDRYVLDSAYKKQIKQNMTHANGIKELTAVKISCKAEQFSSTAKALKGIANLTVVKNKTHLLEITFDKYKQKKTIDFRPKLPMIIRY